MRKTAVLPVRPVGAEPSGLKLFNRDDEPRTMDDLRGVLEASPDAVLVVDDEGIIQRANRHAHDVLGYSPRELEGEVVEELLLKEDRDHHVQFRQGYVDDPEPRPMGSDLDLYALHEDGTSVPVEISLGSIERDGELYVVATISDVSDRRERERQNERLEEFASIVSHDLRNPLSVAAGRLELAQEECDSEHLDAVERSIDRMGALIDDLLTLAREGRMVEDVKPVDLSALVEDCWRNVDTAGASLVAETERTVRADRKRLQQLLENLLRNAVEHGGENVTVEVGDHDDGFYVEDDGPGVPADDRDQLFERGYSTSEGGTGFGLAIVEGIAEAHDWRVRAAEGSSDGARFEVTGVELARA